MQDKTPAEISAMNKAYRQLQKERGILFRSFLIPEELIPEVKEYIRKRSLELGKPTAIKDHKLQLMREAMTETAQT